jgi:hypothetical protein
MASFRRPLVSHQKAAFAGIPQNAIHSLTKGAVRSFTEALRAELVGTSIGVSALFPGAVGTNIMDPPLSACFTQSRAKTAFGAYSSPGRRSAEKRDPDVAPDVKPVRAIEREVTAISPTTRGIVDAPASPALGRRILRLQVMQDLEADDRASSRSLLRVLAVGELAPVLVKGRAQPDDCSAEGLPAGRDLDLSSAALCVPAALRSGGLAG